MPNLIGNPIHDKNLHAIESTFQTAIAAATTQAQARAADIARLQAIVNSGLATGISVESSRIALRSLQTSQNA
jgi:hypothetical protein